MRVCLHEGIRILYFSDPKYRKCLYDLKIQKERQIAIFECSVMAKSVRFMVKSVSSITIFVTFWSKMVQKW